MTDPKRAIESPGRLLPGMGPGKNRGGRAMAKKIKIAVEFETPADVWRELPKDLTNKGNLAQAGVYSLTPADLVACMVLTAAINKDVMPEVYD
jgi:hypothetical protein